MDDAASATGQPRLSETGTEAPARFHPPERFNMAEHFLGRRVQEGRGGRTALLTDEGSWTYRELHDRAQRYGNRLRREGVEPEQRVLIALPDGVEFAAAFFGALRIGAVVVMVNPHLRPDGIEYVLEYTRAKAALVHTSTEAPFREAAESASGRHLASVLTLGASQVERELEAEPAEVELFPSHRDDPAVWLFSGGTTGRPKAVVQPHASFANTTECYAKGVLGYTEGDVTLSVPKLYFGYATGSNLLFPFAVGGTSILFQERPTPEVLFQKIQEHRPTILVNVPTMVRQMVEAAGEAPPDLSSLRLSTSAGEALPVELYRRWRDTFGVELLDGLGTAEMWHIFLSNRPGAVRPGTLGQVVPGFDARVCDEEGRPVPDGEVGELWVRGDSRAIQYWQRMDKTTEAFRGPWYVSGDMVARDPDGYFTYHGRGDDMLKVKGKWLAPREVENRLMEHPGVGEAAVVGVPTEDGLTEAHAYVLPAGGTTESPPELEEELRTFLRERLESYKVPSRILLTDAFPRTHLGKVDRGALRRSSSRGP